MSVSAYRRAREIAAKKIEADRSAALAKAELEEVTINLEPKVEEIKIECKISNSDLNEVTQEVDKVKVKRNKSK